LGRATTALVTPEVTAALAEATDVVGYIPYVARVAPRDGLTLHPSDNRVELDRARAALEMAAAGGAVVVVSSGDPGVFAMASAVFEALEGRADCRRLDIRVLPGITAMLAAAAARRRAAWAMISAPSTCRDNLKPWAVIERRLRLAARPISRWRSTTRARPAARGLRPQALAVLREECGPDRLISPSPARSAPPTSA
jgi:precorrin-3B C17-methyltransferase